MAKGLRSKSAITKDNNDKKDAISLQIKEMQKHIRELFLEARQSHQDGEEKAELASRLAVLE